MGVHRGTSGYLFPRGESNGKVKLHREWTLIDVTVVCRVGFRTSKNWAPF